MGVSIIIVKQTLTDQLNTGCQLKSGIIYELDMMYEQGSNILCTEKCPCKVDKGLFKTEISDTMITDQMGQIKLDECPVGSDVITSSQKERYYPLL